MPCCVSCFNHPWLKDLVRSNATTTGRCGYCGSSPRRLLPIRELTRPFEYLLSNYELAEMGGDPLIHLIQDDWNIFSERISEENAVRLLERAGNLLWDDDSGEPPYSAREFYVRNHDGTLESWLEQWGEFCLEVEKHRNSVPSFPETFEEDLGFIGQELKAGTKLYRARPGHTTDVASQRLPYSGRDIGAPPPGKARAGRVNREGIPVLYCADDRDTALAEIGQAPGTLVSVCELYLRRNANIIDFTQAVEVNPFLPGPSDIPPSYFKAFGDLMWHLGLELATPIDSSENPDQYAACQGLSDRVKASGGDGMRYPSAAHPSGTNVVFFDPDIAEIGPSELIEVPSTLAVQNRVVR